MKILINASLNLRGGGLQVTLSFILHCLNYNNHSFIIVAGDNVYNELESFSFPSHFLIIKVPKLKFYQFDKVLGKIEDEHKPDIAISTFGPVYWRPKVKHIMGFAAGHHIYGDSPFWKRISVLEKLKWMVKRKIHLFYCRRDADAFIVETEDVANRLSVLVQKKCYVVSNTYNQYFENVDYTKKEDNAAFKLLYVCTPYDHKNISIIPSVVNLLLKNGINDVNFVLTIGNQDYDRLIPQFARKYVKTVGVVSPSLLPDLYKDCDAVFVPSLIECFTANYPEAMVSRRPILTSDLSFAHSICYDAAVYFNPLDADDILNKILLVKNNRTLQEDLVVKGLKELTKFDTAASRGDKYIKILQDFLN